MERATGKIIKSQDVHLEGQYHLSMKQTNTKSSQNRSSVIGMPQAQIIENKNECVVIKITCSCGQEISLRCEYDNNKAFEK